VLRKEGNGQRERSTLEFCFTRDCGNKMRMGGPRGGPTWWQGQLTDGTISFVVQCYSTTTEMVQ
jgi:hypothetical protein